MDWSPIWISMKTATLSIIITFFLGVWMARLVVSARSEKVKMVLDGILTLPMVLPPTVAGFFLLMIFGVKRPLGQLFLELFGVKIVFSWAATVIAAVAKTELYYLRSRYYAALRSRMLNHDSRLFKNETFEFNGYVYCMNNPIAYHDPSEIAYGGQFSRKVAVGVRRAEHLAGRCDLRIFAPLFRFLVAALLKGDSGLQVEPAGEGGLAFDIDAHDAGARAVVTLLDRTPVRIRIGQRTQGENVVERRVKTFDEQVGLDFSETAIPDLHKRICCNRRSDLSEAVL